MQDFYGDPFYHIKKAEEYILKHINIGMRLEGMLRVDVPEIDPEAFREAIINAFCHRDYREYDSVNIAIFKDRVEIRSPGLLYGGLTVTDIRKKMLSERRNELMAELFHRVHFIEKWGRGIKMILEREPHTEFEELGTHFIATFRRNSYELTNPIEFGEKYGESPSKTSVKTSVKTSGEIIAAIQADRFVTAQQLTDRIGISLRAVEMQLANLKKDGLIRRVGSKKGGHWEIVSQNN